MTSKCVFLACKQGDLTQLRYLVEHRQTDINIFDVWQCNPLYYACLCGHMHIVDYLLERTDCLFEPDSLIGKRCLNAALDKQIRARLMQHHFTGLSNSSASSNSTCIDDARPLAGFLHGMLAGCSTGDNTYCDLVLLTRRNGHFPVNRCILAAAIQNPQCHKVLQIPPHTPSMPPPRTTTPTPPTAAATAAAATAAAHFSAHLPKRHLPRWVLPDILHLLLSYVYVGSCHPNLGQLRALKRLAHYFGVKSLAGKLDDLIFMNLSHIGSSTGGGSGGGGGSARSRSRTTSSSTNSTGAPRRRHNQTVSLTSASPTSPPPFSSTATLTASFSSTISCSVSPPSPPPLPHGTMSGLIGSNATFHVEEAWLHYKNRFRWLASNVLPHHLCSELHREMPFFTEVATNFADLCIVVRGHQFFGHKVFLLARCEYLRLVLNNSRSAPPQHCEEHEAVVGLDEVMQTIRLDLTPVPTFIQILYYLYHDDCGRNGISLDNLEEILEAADLFLLPGLQRHCSVVLEQALHTQLLNPCCVWLDEDVWTRLPIKTTTTTTTSNNLANDEDNNDSTSSQLDQLQHLFFYALRLAWTYRLPRVEDLCAETLVKLIELTFCWYISGAETDEHARGKSVSSVNWLCKPVGSHDICSDEWAAHSNLAIDANNSEINHACCKLDEFWMNFKDICDATELWRVTVLVDLVHSQLQDRLQLLHPNETLYQWVQEQEQRQEWPEELEQSRHKLICNQLFQRFSYNFSAHLLRQRPSQTAPVLFEE